MNETLWWISRHLDDYHFNSDRARSLKREIQQWTTGSRQEQEETGDKLLRRFRTLFANNPFLEQNGLVGDGRQESGSFAEEQGLSGEITGASADAYFLGDQHFTLRPTVSGRKDPKCFYLNEEAEQSLAARQKRGVQLQRERYEELCNESIARVSKQYDYILGRAVTLPKGGVRKNPTVPGAILCALYDLVLVLLIVKWVPYLTAFGDKIGMAYFWDEKLNRYLLIFTLVMLVVGLVRLKPMVNTMVKGVYRFVYRRKFKQYQTKVQKSRDRVKSLPVEQWFQQYHEAVAKTRALFQKEPEALPIQDATRDLLKKQPGKTLLGDVLTMDPPWSKYSKNGEQGLSAGFVMLLLTVAGVVAVELLMGQTAMLI
jgi:hypothetical protein